MKHAITTAPQAAYSPTELPSLLADNPEARQSWADFENAYGEFIDAITQHNGRRALYNPLIANANRLGLKTPPVQLKGTNLAWEAAPLMKLGATVSALMAHLPPGRHRSLFSGIVHTLKQRGYPLPISLGSTRRYQWMVKVTEHPESPRFIAPFERSRDPILKRGDGIYEVSLPQAASLAGVSVTTFRSYCLAQHAGTPEKPMGHRRGEFSLLFWEELVQV